MPLSSSDCCRSWGGYTARRLPSPRLAATDAERSAATDALAAVYKKIDPASVLDDEEKRKALSEPEKCRLYTRLMSEIQSSPPKDGAAAIRAMTAE